MGFLVFGLVLLGASQPSAAQTREMTISGEPTCESCELRFEHVARLGKKRGDGLIDEQVLVALITKEDRVFILPAAQAAPLVFRTDGRFLGRLGREGEGPGEYQWPTAAVDVGDGRTVIFDPDQGRATVVGPDLKYQRSIRIQGPVGPEASV
jgi:hypothetical protein